MGHLRTTMDELNRKGDNGFLFVKVRKPADVALSRRDGLYNVSCRTAFIYKTSSADSVVTQTDSYKPDNIPMRVSLMYPYHSCIINIHFPRGRTLNLFNCSVLQKVQRVLNYFFNSYIINVSHCKIKK